MEQEGTSLVVLKVLIHNPHFKMVHVETIFLNGRIPAQESAILWRITNWMANVIYLYEEREMCEMHFDPL